MRLIDSNGNQVGVVPIKDAIAKAVESEMDLVEIAPNADPPVCRIVDFKKFLYEQEKKEKEAKKHLKEVEVKEVRLSPFIAQHDFQTRLRRAQEFFDKGNRVKVNIRFTGRQMGHPEFGHQLLDRVLKQFEGKIKIERESRFEGKQLTIILSPTK